MPSTRAPQSDLGGRARRQRDAIIVAAICRNPSSRNLESYYQDALVATRDVLRRDDQLDCDVFDAILVAEPDNEYDSEAVAVYSTRGKIGHAPRGSGWFEVLTILNEDGHAAATCRASLTGGNSGRELGAILHGDPDSELERLER